MTTPTAKEINTLLLQARSSGEAVAVEPSPVDHADVMVYTDGEIRVHPRAVEAPSPAQLIQNSLWLAKSLDTTILLGTDQSGQWCRLQPNWTNKMALACYAQLLSDTHLNA